MSDADNPSVAAKRKQILLLVGLGLAVLGFASVGVWFASDSGPAEGATRTSDIKTKSYIAPGEKVDPQDAWRGVADARLTQIEAKLTSIESGQRTQQKLFDERGKAGAAPASRPSGGAPESLADDDLDIRLKDFVKRAEAGDKPYPGGSPTGSPSPVQSARSTAREERAAQPARGGPEASRAASDEGPIETIRFRADTGNAKQAAPQPGASVDAKGAQAIKSTQNYFPSGMFGRAVVLSGLDAPTGGQSQSNPHPVLLQLLDLAILPNQFRYDWKSCMVTASGYGDISSERAYIRTESLSCVAKDGRVLDVPLRGYIAGEDGKAGMRGRLISKQGQALANALLAGVVGGIGSGLEKSATTTSVSPIGSTTSVKPGQEYKAGIGEGVGKALDRLANYYIQLAEKMFPVIEVDAGRVVDVVLTKGTTVDVDVQN